MNSKGFNLLELMIATAVGIFATLLVTAILKYGSNVSKQDKARGELTETLSLLSEMIIRTGRVSNFCVRESAVALYCGGHYSHAEDDSVSQVRFRFDTDKMLYEERVNLGDPWVVTRTFDGISGFEVCADLQMSTGTCPLEPAHISTLRNTFRTNPNASAADTFFRFRIRAKTTEDNPDEKDKELHAQIQSAFNRRNPTPYSDLGALGGSMTYRWGSK